MARRPSRNPTELELEILKVVWRDEECSARQVQDALMETRALALTSVITVMNIMCKKGYLRRVKGQGCYVYHARDTRESTAGKMVKDLAQRLFGGSTAAMVLNLLKVEEIDKRELLELRQAIEQKEKETAG